MTVFIAFFVLVTVVGFFAARWKRGDLTQLHEWGLGGRQFGAVISWFLVGGDFYTAYTVIAVPALVYSVGAYGFFALPYTIIVYPFVFAVMPKLWKVAHAKNHITGADYVQGEYGGKWFPAAVALTGIVATMPYIALQLVGMQVVIKGLGVTRRNAADRRVRDSRALYVYERPARAGDDRVRQGHHDLYRRDRGGLADSGEARRLRACVRCGRSRTSRRRAARPASS